MDAPDAPETPPSLELIEHGGSWRGQLRLAHDTAQLRRLAWTALAAVVLLIAGGFPFHPALTIATSLGGFLLLVRAATLLIGAVNLPQTIAMDAAAFSLGEERHPLDRIERAEASPGPLTLVLVMRDGSRQVWQVNEEHHGLEDIEWLAGAIRARIAR